MEMERQNKKMQVWNLLAEKIRKLVEESVSKPEELQEIRIRTGQPLLIQMRGQERVLPDPAHPYLVTKEDIGETMGYICHYSLYAYENELKQGFITVEGGHRVGVAVGEDFRFGYERKGTPAMLKEFGKKYGFHTEVLPKEMDGRRKISSTFVREELNRGNMEKFRFLMGTDFSVEGIVEHGRGMGHKYLLPTTNLIPPVEKLMPPNGVYITVSHFRDRSYQGITNVGHKPTVGGEKFIGVETYLFDCNEDLYGEYCKVDFKKFLRPEQKFSSLEALKAQLERDAVKGQEYFETL